jgi:hypothetical protein
MSLFVSSTLAQTPRTKQIKAGSLILAGVLTVMVIAQLFTFEGFPRVIEILLGTDNQTFSHIAAALIVTLEVAALPFLLFMPLSPAMRIVSMVAGWLVMAVWTAFMALGSMLAAPGANSGILGATVAVPVGWWAVPLFIVLGASLGWVGYGLLPRKK